MSAVLTPASGGVQPPESALLPSTPRNLPLAVRGEGVWIWDEQGKAYLDGSSGPVAANLGQCHPSVVAAIAEQAATLSFAHRIQFRNAAAERLAEELVPILGEGFGRVSFVNSGSEANELALKTAFMYWSSQGHPDKTRFVTTANSYHGNTLASLQLSGQPRYSANFRPLVHDNERVRAPYLHRIRVDEADMEPERVVLERLREDFRSLDHRRTAAVLIETVGGASAGALVPPAGYFELLRELCDEHRILWIADEVMSGFGRTGEWFGFQHWNAEPDIVTFAKGVSGGHAPLGGIGVSTRVAEAVVQAYGAVTSGHTFSNNPITAAAGLETVRVMHRERLVEAAASRGEQLREGLRAIAEECASIVDVRGLGLMVGVEFGEASTGRPFAAERDFTARIIESSASEGLLVYPARGGVDGVRGDAVVIAPPLIITETETVELLRRFRRALVRVEGYR